METVVLTFPVFVLIYVFYFIMQGNILKAYISSNEIHKQEYLPSG
jgi:hypothetical protein